MGERVGRALAKHRVARFPGVADLAHAIGIAQGVAGRQHCALLESASNGAAGDRYRALWSSFNHWRWSRGRGLEGKAIRAAVFSRVAGNVLNLQAGCHPAICQCAEVGAKGAICSHRDGDGLSARRGRAGKDQIGLGIGIQIGDGKRQRAPVSQVDGCVRDRYCRYWAGICNRVPAEIEGGGIRDVACLVDLPNQNAVGTLRRGVAVTPRGALVVAVFEPCPGFA